MLRTLSRRRALAAGGSAFAMLASARATSAAPLVYRYASNLGLDHPLNVGMNQCWDAVRRETGGRLDVRLFPNSQLGGDTDVLAQVRSGAVEFMTLDGGILQGVVPVAAIQGVGFAFKDSADAFRALDGPLGNYIRAEIEAAGLYVHPKMWENGMRQITTSVKPIHGPDDLVGLKIRTPAGALWVDLFRALGAAPVAINFAETYTALQTRTVDAEENPFAVVDTAKLYEVQKYLSVTNHMWSAYHVLGNRDAWAALPSDIRSIVDRNLTKYALAARRETMSLNDRIASGLVQHGMIINTADSAALRARLTASGFYRHWRDQFGSKAWELLEVHTGRLA